MSLTRDPFLHLPKLKPIYINDPALVEAAEWLVSAWKAGVIDCPAHIIADAEESLSRSAT